MATSQRRQWLNAPFLNGSFAIDEKNRIIETTLSNHCKEIIDTTDKYGQKSEKINYVQQEATNDKIFLLSVKECKTFNLLKDENWSGMSKDGLKSTYRGRDWYTRTVGAHRYKDDKLSVWGFVTNSGDSSSVATLRPAMWIDLSCADDVVKRVRVEKIAEEKRLQEEKIAEEIKQKQAEKQLLIDKLNREKVKVAAEGNANLIAGIVGLLPTLIFMIVALVVWSNAYDKSDIGEEMVVFISLMILLAIMPCILLIESYRILKGIKTTISSAPTILRRITYILTAIFVVGLLAAWLQETFWAIVLILVVFGIIAVKNSK